MILKISNSIVNTWYDYLPAGIGKSAQSIFNYWKYAFRYTTGIVNVTLVKPCKIKFVSVRERDYFI